MDVRTVIKARDHLTGLDGRPALRAGTDFMSHNGPDAVRGQARPGLGAILGHACRPRLDGVPGRRPHTSGRALDKCPPRPSRCAPALPVRAGLPVPATLLPATLLPAVLIPATVRRWTSCAHVRAQVMGLCALCHYARHGLRPGGVTQQNSYLPSPAGTAVCLGNAAGRNWPRRALRQQ